MVEIRKITEAEQRRAKKLWTYAFSYWSDEEVKEEELIYRPEWTLGLFEEKKLLSTVVILPLQQSIRGILKGMGGVGEVSTYPEARRRGYIRELMKAAFVDMQERELPVSMLGPFKDSFYAEFGYVMANSHLTVKVPLKSLRYALKEENDVNWEVERKPAVDGKIEFLNFLMDFAPARYHGFVLMPDIPDKMWKKRNKDAIIVFVRAEGKIQALARFRFRRVKRQEGIDLELIVHEMYWRTLPARAKLFNFFAKHIDNVVNISLHVPFGVSFEQWFRDAVYKMELSDVWMVRVVDVEQAITNLPAEGTEEITVEICDPHCEWNQKIFTIHADGERLHISSSTRKPKARLDIEGLSALVYGTLPLEEVEFRGWAEIADPQVRTLLNRWFPPVLMHNALSF